MGNPSRQALKRNISPLVALAGFVLLCEAVGILGSVATVPAIPTWYAGLDKPAWTPPDWVFGPVWTTLYAMMGVAAWRVWRLEGDTRMALTAFAVQLALNGLWSPLFFGLKRIDLGLVDIAALWVAILVTVILFFRHSRLAGALMLPYFAWASYATALNFTLWRLNGAG